MPEDVLISLLQGHFSSSHTQGPVSGETEAPGWDDLFMSQVPTAGQEQWQAGLLGAVGSMESRAQDRGF